MHTSKDQEATNHRQDQISFIYIKLRFHTKIQIIQTISKKPKKGTAFQCHPHKRSRLKLFI